MESAVSTQAAPNIGVAPSCLASLPTMRDNLLRLHITARPMAKLSIPAFSGSMIRGALGHVLKQRHCACGVNAQAQHQPDCMYARLFETGSGSAFVITPPAGPRMLAARHQFTFQITLLDYTNETAAVLLSALAVALQRGLGSDSVPCMIDSVDELDWTITPLDQDVTLRFLSPWFLKHKGEIVNAASCRVHDVLVGITQRQRQVAHYLPSAQALPDNVTLLRLADQLTVVSDLVDVTGQRRSARQAVKHPLQGVIGTLDISHPQPGGLAPLTLLLHRACWIHGGGKPGFGLGGLAIDIKPKLTRNNFSLPGLMTKE